MFKFLILLLVSTAALAADLAVAPGCQDAPKNSVRDNFCRELETTLKSNSCARSAIKEISSLKSEQLKNLKQFPENCYPIIQNPGNKNQKFWQEYLGNYISYQSSWTPTGIMMAPAPPGAKSEPMIGLFGIWTGALKNPRYACACGKFVGKPLDLAKVDTNILCGTSAALLDLVQYAKTPNYVAAVVALPPNLQEKIRANLQKFCADKKTN